VPQLFLRRHAPTSGIKCQPWTCAFSVGVLGDDRILAPSPELTRPARCIFYNRDVTPGFRYGTPSDVTLTGATAGLVFPINEPLVVRVVKVALPAIRFELFRQASLQVRREQGGRLQRRIATRYADANAPHDWRFART